MTVVSMSNKEFSRLDVLLDLEAGRITIREAGELMGLRRRQVYRLVKAFRERGATSLVSRRRGRSSNNRLPAAVRDLAMAIVKERYADFGPTLAAEKLAEAHGCRVSHETLRQWMMEDGLWLDRRRRLPSVHQPRNRRERVGELVQIDGSTHASFETRGPACTLIVYIDDATSHPTRGFRAVRVNARLFARDPGLCGAVWTPDRLLLRQARDLPGQQAGCGRRRRHDPVWPGAA